MNVSPPATTLVHTGKQVLRALLSDALQSGTPLALWRLPGSRTTHLILPEKPRLIARDNLLEELEPGFMFAPFDRQSKRVFLPADKFFSFEDGILLKPDTEVEERSQRWLTARTPDMPGRGHARPSKSAPAPAAKSKNAFEQIIARCVEEIGLGTFEKVVPSRTRTLALPAGFDVPLAFEKLCSSYPQALISLVSVPGEGAWLGASPEPLVCVEDGRIFKTVALAGTLPYRPGVDIRNVAWTQKEIEEQALVERYVISCFKKIRLREYEEHGPKTVVAGNLMHLRSEFTVDMKATGFPQIGSVMLDLLHPTSAVCGMPLQPSLDFLAQHEGYDRSYYAGYLGPVNIHNDVNLFVNLRCMQVSGDEGILFAGAGVTADSTPEKEWTETEMKFETLLNVIL